MKNIVKQIICIVVVIAIALFIYYLALPALNIRSIGMWCYILGISLIFLFVQTILDELVYKKYTGTKIIGSITGLVLLIILIGGLSSWQIFNADKYKNLVTIEEGNFKEDINQIQNVENLSIVDMETAERLGDRTVGSIKNSAWFEVDDEYNLIEYNDQLYRISPLNYGGFFKSQKAKNEGIPGYVLVNTSTQEAKYVELKNGIKYAPSGYFSYDLKRHLRNNYPSYMFGKSYFEIDEKGNPYYITAVKNPTIGVFGGVKEELFIITNASSGENKEYNVEELPEWLDHAYSLEYLMRASEYNLKYINGFWNSLTSKTNVTRTTYSFRNYDEETGENFAGYNTAITKNGEIVFYTGLTPASNAESNVGFILANPRTGEIKRYACAGAEENSAMSSAESLVQDLKYVATFPTIINVNGEETYFMLLKDKAGLVQRFALCNVENYSKVVQSSTLKETIDLYLEKLGNETLNESEEVKNIESTITNLYQAQIDGSTYYYFTLEGSDNLYMSSIKNSNKQVTLKVGTKVSIEYISTNETGVFLVKKIIF